MPMTTVLLAMTVTTTVPLAMTATPTGTAYVHAGMLREGWPSMNQPQRAPAIRPPMWPPTEM